MQRDNLFTEQAQNDKPTGPVTCLGKTFANDAERRAYFIELLAEKLKDPEFRKIEGFPIGNDEDILNLSDPPYYTACPNPWIANFIAQWEIEKPSQPEGYHYHREPFAADVSEGKNDPIYNAHSYHTKVPHKAIMRYILHYTNPGDILLDGFCGTGMTGVAAQMCGDRNEVMSLGYQVKQDGSILKEVVNDEGIKIWEKFSHIGVRKAILNDLSPAASYIANNYNKPIDIESFRRNGESIIKEVDEECAWMYTTKHSDGLLVGKIIYTVWSDVFTCNECQGEIVYWERAVDFSEKKVKEFFECKHCSAKLSKSKLSRSWISFYDENLKETVKFAKQVPVLLRYHVNGKQFEKKPDLEDFKRLDKINEFVLVNWFPRSKMPIGANTKQPEASHGFTHVHHFYTKRNLIALSSLFEKCSAEYKLIFQSIAGTLCSKLVRYNMGNRGNGVLNGTLYMPSLSAEAEVTRVASGKIKDFSKAFISKERCLTQCGSFERLIIPSESLDYIFIDPPFGANINYSELNYIWESWHNVITNNLSEAIENNAQNKTLTDYRNIIAACFKEAYRLLKPGRWITVEFSNTRSAVWNSIQSALSEAGFIIANVSALDKKQGSFKAVTTTTAVKQDLVISAYKPNSGFEDRFKDEVSSEIGVWDFIRTHLNYLPIFKVQDNSLLQIPERDPRILFDQVVAYYVRKGYHLPVSSQEFQAGLAQRFVERDGMYFLNEQAAEYDKKKAVVGELVQISLFVKDEASAIQWIRQLLKLKPQVFSEINPQFMQQLSGWSKNEVQLDLREILKYNFIYYDGKEDVPDQIHSYLSTNWKELRNLAKTDPELKVKAKDRWYVPDPKKAGDLEKIREQTLLKEFEEYKTAKKKLKVFRIEAVRAGFKKLWEAQEFASILEISTKLPNDVIAEDPILLMYYDQATMLSQHNNGGDW